MTGQTLSRSATALTSFAVDATTAGRLLARLPSFVRHSIAPEQARTTLAERLARRESTFLAFARRAIYENRGSPYLELLALAGCEYADLERLVREAGVEGALQTLYTSGVYLTVEEFKGRRPTIRGSATLRVDPARLVNPATGFHMLSQSSGSRGARTRVPIDLEHICDRAVDLCLVYAAREGLEWVNAFWGAPGGATVVNVLLATRIGSAPAAWFSQVDLADVHPRYRWGAEALRAGSALGGKPLPRLEYVPLEHPAALVSWLTGVVRRGKTPHLYTYASGALRLCQAAADAGTELSGARLTITGEPITASRLAAIEATGATVAVNYGINEAGGFLGYSCLAREEPDEVHFFDDLHALVQVDGEPAGRALPDGALLLTSLCATAPIVLLNVSTGDHASVGTRSCGCSLERYGWTTHVHTIRSFEKLTAGGAAFHQTDVIRVLEEELPARFGGRPTQYQLLEEQADEAGPRLRLLVDPAVGDVDPDAVVDVFLDAMGRGAADQLDSLVWRHLRAVRVERRVPVRTASGKFQHVHVGVR
jgi:hypothetical protein